HSWRAGCSVGGTSRGIRKTDVTEYWIGTAASFRLDVGSPDYLAPLLGFFGDQFPKLGGREREHVATAAPHSITSSAPCGRNQGTSRPSAFAVLRLMTNSNLVGLSIGRSCGFAPFKILST